MEDKVKIYNEINMHLMDDEKPSIYLKKAFEDGKLDSYPFNMLSDLVNIEQNKKYHPEGNVWNHVLMVVDEAAKRKSESKEPRVLMWAALLHDIGKGPTTKVRKGKITSYKHERVGKEMAIKFLDEFTDNQDFIDKVSKMVRWHMEALFVIKNLPFANIGQMLKEIPLEEIAILNLCDRLGRGDMTSEKANGEIKAIEMFVDKCKKYMKDHNREIITV